MDQANANQWDCTISSKKTGCSCCLVIKLYPDTNTMLDEYEGKHDHPLGDNNLQFLRLSENTRKNISWLCQIVEDEEIHLDDNDVISIRLWVTRLQQSGTEAVLKDKRDSPPWDLSYLNNSLSYVCKPSFKWTAFGHLDLIFYLLMPLTIPVMS